MRRFAILALVLSALTLSGCGAPRAVGSFFTGGPDYFQDKHLVCSGKIERVIDGDFGRRWIGVEDKRLLQKEGLYTYFGHEASSDAGERLDSQMQTEVVTLNPGVSIDDLAPGDIYYAPKECHLVKIKNPDAKSNPKPKKGN